MRVPSSTQQAEADVGMKRQSWVVVGAVLLVWATLLRPNDPFADDFPYLSLLDRDGWLGSIKEFGFWRPLGGSFPMWAYLIHPLGFPLLCLGTHLASSLLMLRAFDALLGRGGLSLLLALGFAVLPVGVGAMPWMAAYHFVLGVPFFWLLVVVIAGARTVVNDANASPATVGLRCLACAVAAFTTLISNECLLFSLMGLPFLLWIDSKKPLADLFHPKSKRKWAVTVSVWAAIILWMVLMRVASHTPKELNFNPATLLSYWFYQYTLPDMLTGIFSPEARALMFYKVGALSLVAALIGLVVLGIALLRQKGPTVREMPSPAPQHQWRNLLLVCAGLLIGTSLVYVIGGGYSLDSRKKYAVFPLMLLALGAVDRWWNSRISQAIQPRWRLATVALVVIGFATTWTVMGVWNYQSDLYTVAMKKVASESTHSRVDIQWTPDIYASWPQYLRSGNNRIDTEWIQSEAIDYRRRKFPEGTPPVSDSPPPRLRQIPGKIEFEWVR